jgi:methionine sulfoxide reductase heme-binding subunit
MSLRPFIVMIRFLLNKPLRIAVHSACWIPLAWLLWDAYTDNLTFNPIQEITFRTGKTALILLVLSLAITPLNTVFGLKQLVPLRRPLGLYAFMYAALHFSIFVWLDYGFDLQLIGEAIAEKRYVLVGFAAFLLLLPLAITSTKGWMRRLGKRWKQLHRLVYVAAALVIFHYVWLVKADIREPLAYGAAVALLFVLRAPPVRRAITRFRQRRMGMPGVEKKPQPTKVSTPDKVSPRT